VYAQLAAARREAENERRERERVQQVAAAEIANRDAALANQAQVIMQQGASSSRANEPSQLGFGLLEMKREVDETQEILMFGELENVSIRQKLEKSQIKNERQVLQLALERSINAETDPEEVDRVYEASRRRPVFNRSSYVPPQIDLVPAIPSSHLSLEELRARFERM
jgi:hypothetical protein